jgi:Flp pilus assembly protein TadG
MRARLQALLARLRRLALVEDGVAAVEFALILPIMLLVYIGSVEASLAITMDRKVQLVAGALGDLVARSDTTIPAGTLEDFFQAAGGIMTPYPADELKQVVTQVLVSADGATASVVWSRQYVEGVMSVGTDHAQGASFTLPAAMRAIAQGSYVIVAESSYAHTPLSGFVFNQPINLYRENFLLPRFGGSITVN